jgi:hypothetical protein
MTNAQTTGVIGLPMTETFTISDINAPLILSFEPIFSSLAFGRNNAVFTPVFTHSGKVLTIQGLQIGDEIRVNYKPMDAMQWNRDVTATILIAASAVSGQRVVTIDSAYADATIPSHAFRIAGVTKTAASNGASVEVIRRGELTDNGWNWDTAKPILLGLDGFLTQTLPPSAIFAAQIAVAVAATRIYINIEPPILFG